MIPIGDRLSQLKELGKKLAQPSNKKDEKIGKEALKALAGLEDALKKTDLSPQEWNEVYETVLPFTKIDFSHLKPELIEKVQTLFSKTFAVSSAPQRIQSLVQSVDQKRVKSTQMFFEKEKHQVMQEHKSIIQEVMSATTGELTAAALREKINLFRKKNPRTMISAQDEANLLRDEIKKIVIKLPVSNQSTHLINAIKLIDKNLFTFENCIEKAIQDKPDQFGTVVLEPSHESFDPKQVEKLKIQRLYRLENLEAVYKETINNPNTQVSNKFFPKAKAFYVGAFQGIPSYSLMELEMQTIAERHGIKVISDVRINIDDKPVPISKEYRTDLMLDCRPMLGTLGMGNLGPFSQDYVDFSQNGEVRIPRMNVGREQYTFENELDSARIARSDEWQKITEENQNTPIPGIGVPFTNDLALKALALSSALGAEPIMNLTYNEGGNTLIGQKDSKPFLIIGKDTYDMSKLLMEKDLGRKMSDDEVRMAFGIDYGVAKEQIYFVEQPGDFHLDMSMAIMGGNTVLLNDSALAQQEFEKDQQIWLEKSIKEHPENEKRYRSLVQQEIESSIVRKKMEDITAKDLGEQGFNVVRVPGKFHYNVRRPAMNLFNMVTFETAEGKNIAVLLGCIDKRYTENFEKILSENCSKKIDSFHYIDLKSSQESLDKGGGIACRTKILT